MSQNIMEIKDLSNFCILCFKMKKRAKKVTVLINLNYIFLFYNNDKLKQKSKGIDEWIQQQLWKQTQLRIIYWDIEWI